VSGRVGIVAIGRNEGERLRQCLAAASAPRHGIRDTVVYVDSGSTDGSRDLALSYNAHVVDLDLTTPFTAARARNEGFAKLMQVDPTVEFVQFLDGDCELRPDWIDRALKEFNDRPSAAVICGRRRERHPNASIYNQLIDQEWDTPIGRADACGGDALIRVRAFQQVGGYNASVIAGEEPEMCVRLRQAGWEIWRIDAEMTLHDAAIFSIDQWWKRNLRSGHAYAEGAAMHGAPPERHWVREVKSNYLWGLALPIAAILFPPLILIFPLQILRIAQRRGAAGAWAYAFFTVLGKIPQALGQLKYANNRRAGRKSGIIEYKGATASQEGR
jgi:GT2 family glycosyltransferase